MISRHSLFLAPILFLLTGWPGTCVRAQDTAPEWTEVSIDLPYSGRIEPKTTHEISGHVWSVGGETMDRDYTLYDEWKEYVEPLGVKQIRLQSGWAKTEKEKGEYDFAWLDHIVRDLVDRGVKPWISLSYGNPNYRGGGGTLLGAAIPSTGGAFVGWQNYVRATVERYADVVDTWEIWNEPNNHFEPGAKANSPQDYGNLLLTTSRIIREVQPRATIIGMSTAGVGTEYSSAVLRYLREQDALDAIDLVGYHPYSRNPDSKTREVEELRDSVRAYGANLDIFQGENGAPSEFRKTKALRGYPWTELSQAKWFLRRALTDHGMGIGSNLFSIADLKYPDEINRKGLLLTNDAKEVVRPKHAYYAVQYLATVFDDSLEPRPDYDYTAATYHSTAGFAFTGDRGPVVALWFDASNPSDYNGTTAVDFTFPGLDFTDPVYVDLRTGQMYEIPADRHESTDGGYCFRQLPIYDSPVLVAERGALPQPTR